MSGPNVNDPEEAQRQLMASFRQEGVTRATAQAEEARMPGWRRRLRRMRAEGRLGLIIAIAVAVVVVGSCVAFFGVNLADKFHMVDTAKQFCRDEAAGNYDAAYQLLSARAKAADLASTFATESQNARLVDCSETTNIYQVDQFDVDRMTLSMTYLAATADSGPPGTNVQGTEMDTGGSMTLVREGGGWRIDAITSSLANFSF